MRSRPQAPHSPLSARHHPDSVPEGEFDSHRLCNLIEDICQGAVSDMETMSQTGSRGMTRFKLPSAPAVRRKENVAAGVVRAKSITTLLQRSREKPYPSKSVRSALAEPP